MRKNKDIDLAPLDFLYIFGPRATIKVRMNCQKESIAVCNGLIEGLIVFDFGMYLCLPSCGNVSGYFLLKLCACRCLGVRSCVVSVFVQPYPLCEKLDLPILCFLCASPLTAEKPMKPVCCGIQDNHA